MRVAAVGLVLAGAVVLMESYALQRLRRERYREHVEALTAAAQADSTIRRLEGDRAVARRQVQQVQVALDKATHESAERGVALAELQAKFETLYEQTTGTVEVLATEYQVAGALDAWDTAGVQVAASVLVPFDTVGRFPATWNWRLERAPLDLTVDFACRADTAVAHVAGPRWASIAITSAMQRPDVCTEPPRPSPVPVIGWRLPSLPVGMGLVWLGWVIGVLTN